jgi:hypothetical protein
MKNKGRGGEKGDIVVKIKKIEAASTVLMIPIRLLYTPDAQLQLVPNVFGSFFSNGRNHGSS